MGKWLRSQRLWRNKDTGETSSDYYSLLTTDRLTLDADCIKYPRPHDGCTMFREIELVSLYDALDNADRDLLDTAPQPEEPVDSLIDTIAETVAKAWSPDKFHVISHSSGTDSRILSVTIRRLYRERGDGWLDKALFFCREWETEAFKAIMRHEGWKREQWAIVGEDVEPNEWHAASLDFETAWQWHNGPARSAIAWWLYPIRWLQRDGLIPTDNGQIQLWTGLGDMRVKSAWKGRLYEEMSRYYYQSEAAGMRNEWETHHLWHSHRIIKQAARLHKNMYHRLRILAAIDPVLAELPRASRLGDYRTLSDGLYERVNADYDASAFGRMVWPDVQRTKQAHLKLFWQAYTAASLCQHLLRRGVQIDGLRL